MTQSSFMDRAPIVDPLTLIPRLLTKFHSWWLRTTYPFASVGQRFSIHYTCDLQKDVARHMRIGNDVLIAKDAWLNVVADEKVDHEPIIIVDDGCVIARRCTISARNGIHFERNVILAASALIMDHNHAYQDVTVPIKDQGVTEGGRIRIGEGTWIGHGAAIVCDKGELVLGRNCVVAANALVSRSFPDYSVIVGNPARVVKQFDPAKGDWVLGSSRPSEQLNSKQAVKDARCASDPMLVL
jgi:acetyltransferase-like isoleucine patch superfamily enzyme